MANTTLDPERVLLTIRPVLGNRPWPFPSGRSLCVRGAWPLGARDPEFRIQSVLEVSDAPRRSFERVLEVFTYRAAPARRMRRTDNALSTELVASMPLISQQTAERLEDWTEYLQW